MPKRRGLRWILLLVVGLFFGVVIADTLGVFDTLPYVEVPHGNHTHYLPKGCGTDLDLDRFPTVRPAPGQRITCDGQVVNDPGR